MQLHEITHQTRISRPSKRVGRGNAAGGGTTAGRGTKGQKARSGGQIPIRFEGGQTPFSERIPKQRGFKPKKKLVWRVVNLTHLSQLASEGKVTLKELWAKGILRKKNERVKLLGGGEVNAPFLVEVHAASKGARAKIEQSGGKVILLEKKQ